MAEKDQVKPFAPAVNRASSDEESATLQSDELRRKKRIKIIGYVVVFILFQTAVFAALGLTVLRVKAPNVKINSVDFESVSTDITNPAFNMRFIAEVSVKNKNWGEYKFRNSTMILSYHGVTVGEAQIPARKAKARGTRRMNVTVDVSSDRLASNHPNLSTDLSSGILTLNSYTKLSGKVTLMYMMKRSKSGEMNCTMAINTASRVIQGLNCK